MRYIFTILALTASVLAASAMPVAAQDADYLHDTDFVYVGQGAYKAVVWSSYVDTTHIKAVGNDTFNILLLQVDNGPERKPTDGKYEITYATVYCRDKTIRNFSAKEYTAEGKFHAHYSLKSDPVAMTADASDKPAFDYVCMSDKDRAAAGYWSSKASGIDPMTDADSRYAKSLPQ